MNIWVQRSERTILKPVNSKIKADVDAGIVIDVDIKGGDWSQAEIKVDADVKRQIWSWCCVDIGSVIDGNNHKVDIEK